MLVELWLHHHLVYVWVAAFDHTRKLNPTCTVQLSRSHGTNRSPRLLSLTNLYVHGVHILSLLEILVVDYLLMLTLLHWIWLGVCL